MGKRKLMLAINCYHLIDSPGTPTLNLSKYHHARPASDKKSFYPISKND